jgi:hypothetical protein
VEIQPTSLPLCLRSADLLLDGEISPPQFVVKPFFPRGELTEIVGPHGAFKSTIALDACLAIATGRPWGGRPTTKGRTVFITLEDSTWTVARRVRAWLDGVYQDAPLGQAEAVAASVDADLRANFSFLAREDAQGLTLTSTEGTATRERGDVSSHLAVLTDGASLVVLETVSRLHDGPETNDAFPALVRALERIARNGAAVVIVRHMSKRAAREMNSADTIDSYAGRGGGALSDAVRSCLVVTRQTGGRHAGVTLTAAKTTHAQPGETISWRPRVVAGFEAVRLEVCSPQDQARADADLLWAHINAKAKGVTATDIHKNPPPALSRQRASEALELLKAEERVIPREERRGKNRQPTTVFFTPRPGLEAA